MDSGTAGYPESPGGAAKGDIVRHKHHGVGVVLGTDGFCQVRFLGGKGHLERASLTVLVAANHAERFVAETLASREIDGDLLRGATLWLRSDDADLRAIAIALISPLRDPSPILIAEGILAEFPPRVRSRATNRLSEARAQRDLDSWPDTVRAIIAERDARRLMAEEDEAARCAEIDRARQEADVNLAVRSQIANIAAIRMRLGKPPLNEEERDRIDGAVRARQANPNAYRNVCWNCRTPVHSSFNPHCSACGWLVCVCGGCRAPNFVDRQGRSGPCRMEMDLLPVPSNLGLWS